MCFSFHRYLLYAYLDISRSKNNILIDMNINIQVLITKIIIILTPILILTPNSLIKNYTISSKDNIS